MVQVAEPGATQSDPNPNQWITVWHPDLEFGTGYYHPKPGTLVRKIQGEQVFPDNSIARFGNSGTKDPHQHTGGHILDATGLCPLTPLRFNGLTDDQGNSATQTPATGTCNT